MFQITRLHKLKRVEEEVLRYLRSDDEQKPAYEHTLQQFFEYVAKQKDNEKWVVEFGKDDRKRQVFLSEQQKTEIMKKYITREKKRGYIKILAQEYNVSETTIHNIIRFITIDKYE